MNWSIAIAVALANAVGGFLFTMLAGWAYMTILDIHDKDGGGSMALFFVFAPIAAVVGLIWGLVATGIIGAGHWSQFHSAFMLAQVLPNAAVLLFTAGAMVFHEKSSPTGPFTQNIEVELELPGPTYRAWMSHDSTGYVALRSSPYSTSLMERRGERFDADQDLHHITADAQLFSLTARQRVELRLADGRSLAAELPKLEPPAGDSSTWSGPIPFRWAEHGTGTDSVPTALLRFRIFKVTFLA